MNHTYTPTQASPQFTKFQDIRNDMSMTLERYEEWRASLPPSPVDSAIRMIVRGAYSLMEHRIAMGNQLFAQFRSKLGLNPSDKASAEKEAAKILKRLEEDYKKITDGVARELPLMRNFKGEGLIERYAELVLVHNFMALSKDEKAQFNRLTGLLSGIPVYDFFLELIPGIGEKLAGMLLSELNPYRAPNASSFWRFMGLDVHTSGRGRGIANTMLEAGWMRVRDGEGYKLDRVTNRTYNAKRKARLVKIGMEGIIKQALRWVDADDDTWENRPPQYRRMKDDVKQVTFTNCPYGKAYLDYRHRLTHSDKQVGGKAEGKLWKDEPQAHRHEAARRYMAKMFLRDFWLVWRMFEGLPITDPYEVAYLGQRPHHEGPNIYVMPALRELEKQGMVKFDTSPAQPGFHGSLDFDGLEDLEEEVA